MKKFSKVFAITMTTFCAFTIVIMSVMDLNSTHMTNPLWPPHARFHWAIQYFSSVFVNLTALYMIWGNYKEKGSLLSILITGLAPMFFWTMFFPALMMPGTGTWPDGVIPPPSFPVLLTKVHPNFIMSVLITGTSVWMIRRELILCKVKVKA